MDLPLDASRSPLLLPRTPVSLRRHHALPTSPTKPTRHLSPRKFHQLQKQQRDAVLRGMLPLSPISPTSRRAQEPPNAPQASTVPWNPAWLPFPMECLSVASPPRASISGGFSIGTTTLDAWLQSYDRDMLQFESIEKFAQVKLPEAMAFCDKMERHIADVHAQEQAEATLRRLQEQQHAGSRRQGRQATSRRVGVTTAMARFPVCFRIAVFASLLERSILAMTESAGLAYMRPWLLQARQELFRAVFADYEPQRGKKNDEDEEKDENEEESESESESKSDSEKERKRSVAEDGDTQPDGEGRSGTELGTTDSPHSLDFFLSRVPFLLKLQDDSQRRSMRFQRHQVVLRRIVQSLYRSLGSVFHAWKMYVKQRRDERLHDKGAQLTAMVVMQRGLVRTVFVEWSKCTLQSKLRRMEKKEAYTKKHHEERVNELYREVFLLREENRKLHDKLQSIDHRKGVSSEDEEGEIVEEVDT